MDKLKKLKPNNIESISITIDCKLVNVSRSKLLETNEQYSQVISTRATLRNDYDSSVDLWDKHGRIGDDCSIHR